MNEEVQKARKSGKSLSTFAHYLETEDMLIIPFPPARSKEPKASKKKRRKQDKRRRKENR